MSATAESLGVYEVDYGERTWVVARDEEDAVDLANVESDDYLGPNVTVRRLLDDETLRVLTDEGGEAHVEMTARDWAATEGRGIIASTEV